MARTRDALDGRRASSRKEEILDRALKLFSEYGVHAVTTRQIAAAVGVSQPSLYAHFPNKHALASQVSERAFDRLAARMAARGANLAGPEDLKAMARVYIDFGLTEPDAYKIAFMTDAPRGGEEVKSEDPALEAGKRAFRLHRDAIAKTIGAGLDEEALEILAQSLWASIHGLVSLLIARPSFPWADREALITAHLDRLVPEAWPAGAQGAAMARRRPDAVQGDLDQGG